MLSRAFPLAMLCAALAAGCASSGTPDPADAASHTVVVTDGRLVESVTAATPKQTFAYPADKVWSALNAAYAVIGVDVVLRDNATRRIGNPNFYRSGQTNGESVSHFANCGNGMTGAIANSWRVYFSVITTLTAVDATHTALTTEVDPVAVDVSGSNSERTTCESTGGFEQLLYASVAQQLGQK